jgi:hypothetical protein
MYFLLQIRIWYNYLRSQNIEIKESKTNTTAHIQWTQDVPWETQYGKTELEGEDCALLISS